MLTNDDVKKLKGAMKGVIHDETPGIVRKIVQDETPGIVRKIVQEETPGIVRKIVQEETPVIVEKALKPVKKDIRKIKKDVTTIIDYFDRGQMKLEKRVDRIEKHLDLPPMSPMTFVSPNN